MDVAVVPKFYTGSDYRLLRGRFSFTRRGEKAANFTKRTPRTIIDCEFFASLVGIWEDTIMNNIDDEYKRGIEHTHDCTRKRVGVSKPSRDAFGLVRQCGAARAAGNQELTSELAMLCRGAKKEDLKERRTEVLAEAAEARQSIRYVRRTSPFRQNNNDSPDPRWNNHSIEKGDRKGHSRLLLGFLRQRRPLASPPSEGRWTCHSKGALFRSPTCL